MSELSLLGIFAHPDDEQLVSGTLAKAAAEGIRTGLLCATRGEYGEIADPSLATPENLGQVREHEMRAAAAVIGVKYLYFLDYKDSGWFGAPQNEAPDSFNKADVDEAAGKIVKLLREFRPSVIVTFDPSGGYGHYDHVKAYQLARKAFDDAADPRKYPGTGEAWQTQRLFYSSFPRSQMRRFREAWEQLDLTSSYSDLDTSSMGLSDEEITNALDVSEWVPVKEKSLECHRTQMDPNSPFRKAPREMVLSLRATEYFALAKGVDLPETPEARGDLFAGLR